MIQLYDQIQTEVGYEVSVLSPLVMRQCSLSPSRISTYIHGLIKGHDTSRDILVVTWTDA